MWPYRLFYSIGFLFLLTVDMDKITATLMAEVEKKMGKKVEELEKEVERLKTTVSDYEQRIKTLEESKWRTNHCSIETISNDFINL